MWRSLRIRTLIAGLLLAVSLGGAEAKDPQGALGANFNEHLADLRFDELELGRTKWVRGFYAMPLADKKAPMDDPGIRKFLQARERGYGVVLNMKFPFQRRAFPKPGTPQMAREMQRVTKLLTAVMGRVDILVIGNEPFIESRRADRNEKLNAFYEYITKQVIAFRRDNCGANCSTQLYLGALNRLQRAENHTAATDRWVRYAASELDIKGVDIHPHVASIEDSRPFVDYVLQRLRPDQRFLVTEFSLVRHWKKHLTDVAPAGFLSRYDMASNLKVWQVIGAAIKSPFPQEKWNDFLASSPWYESRRNYICNQMALFRATERLAVAAHGYIQGPSAAANWGPDKTPWLLNSVFAQQTVRNWPDGTPGRGYAWIGNFRHCAEPNP
ncbi:hypothetical protein GCM10011491_09990 [Brucella endophytica]|uniref:Glycoside hydrolase family 5 domain-containing protein n=1 Tax=Brucella endophytica TaxID=1963359 RepID=A0A916WBL6_9HYPH|nr:hypothetical protein [Brucella endophytica]GGA84469.1 hypothetical protein GCM10011491_09990 [Brucella endophytica]